MSIAVQLGLDIVTFDVSSCFLHSNLDAIVLARFPKGDDRQDERGVELILCLFKAVNGVRQGPAVWSRDRTTFMLQQLPQLWNHHSNPRYHNVRVKVHPYDPAIYVVQFTDDSKLFIVAWVDDFLAIGATADCHEYGTALGSRYRTTGGERITSWIGSDVDYDIDNGVLKLNQDTLIEKYLQIVGLEPGTSTPTKTPMEVAHSAVVVPDAEGQQRISALRTQVGILLFLISQTVPEIAYSVGFISRHLAKPNKAILGAAKRIGRYLLTRLGQPFIIRRKSTRGPNSAQPNRAQGNLNDCIAMGSDATWNDSPTGKFTIGYCAFVCNNLVSWKSRKSRIQALSTFEAETIAMSDASREALFLRNFIAELGWEQTSPTELHGDNSAAILHANEHKVTQQSKHIALRYWHARTCAANGWITNIKIPGRHLVADTFTKSLPIEAFELHKWNLLGSVGPN
jgi:hypothetical protein